MYTNWRSEITLLLIVVGMFVAAAVIWPYSPESFPVHWNIRGEVDRHGGRFEGLLLLPLIAVGLYGLLLYLPRIDPGRANYPSFRSAYFVIRLSILLFFAALYAVMLFTAFGYAIDIVTVIPIGVGMLFIVLGNVMGKIRPNHFVGVRTPWTLSSRRSWNKTHHLAGWLFVLMGVTLGACGFVRQFWMLCVAGAVILISLIWMTVYSYLIWRDDPEKLSPSAITPLQDGSEAG